tara:strand:- start:3564 stop:3770 length:207 start_codon:yes stop_codon:yes gene_type:complete
MLFKINSIYLDFSCDDPVLEEELGDDYQQVITNDVLATTWKASDEDDLIEEITNCTGWCIKSIDYDVV